MCTVLEIIQRTYYKYRNCEDKNYYDYLLIKEIFDESKGTYHSQWNYSTEYLRKKLCIIIMPHLYKNI